MSKGENIMKALFVILFAVTQLHATTATAQINDESDVLYQTSLDVRDQFVTALENKDFTSITHQAMGDAIAMLAQELRDRSDEESASALESVWNQNEGVFFTAQLTDLGDHAPLIPKLEDYFKTLSTKYGTILMSLPLVQDIRTLNFALPVVFQPKGSWQSADYDNRIEYRKHFIPFANIVTYYGVLVACNIVAKKSAQPDLKKVCKPAAEKLRFAMGRYIAPQVSDWIFKETNKQIAISSSQLKYTTADELRAAIQHGIN
jgi:Zn-dependent protease with chaperone function